MIELLESAAKTILEEAGVMGAVFLFTVIPLAIFAYRANNKVHLLQESFLNEIKDLTVAFTEEIQSISDKRIEESQDMADRLAKLHNLWRNTVEKQLKDILHAIKKIQKDD